MSISQRILVLVLLSTLAPFAYGQEDEAKQDLLQALGQLEKSEVSFSTKLTEEQPAAEDDIYRSATFHGVVNERGDAGNGIQRRYRSTGNERRVSHCFE